VSYHSSELIDLMSVPNLGKEGTFGRQPPSIHFKQENTVNRFYGLDFTRRSDFNTMLENDSKKKREPIHGTLWPGVPTTQFAFVSHYSVAYAAALYFWT